MQLADIYPKYSHHASYGDKGTVHSYIEVYEELLASRRETARNVVEIGILSGMSLRMWEEYFQNANVYGTDLCDQPLGGMCDLRPMIAEGNHKIRLFDATDRDAVNMNFAGIQFDVIIEDASHMFSHQMEIYYNMRRFMAPGGIYIIEDVDEIDLLRPAFERMDPYKKIEIIDRRSVKGRFDDVLVVIR